MRILFFLTALFVTLSAPAQANYPAPLRIDIAATQIARAEFEELGLWVKLNPAGLAHLREAVGPNPDRPLDIYVLDEPAMRSVAWASVLAGNLNIAQPSERLSRKVRPYLSAAD